MTTRHRFDFTRSRERPLQPIDVDRAIRQICLEFAGVFLTTARPRQAIIQDESRENGFQ